MTKDEQIKRLQEIVDCHLQREQKMYQLGFKNGFNRAGALVRDALFYDSSMVRLFPTEYKNSVMGKSADSIIVDETIGEK